MRCEWTFDGDPASAEICGDWRKRHYLYERSAARYNVEHRRRILVADIRLRRRLRVDEIYPAISISVTYREPCFSAFCGSGLRREMVRHFRSLADRGARAAPSARRERSLSTADHSSQR